jgi:NitT/TauT family transport system ATP-binding protein
MVGVMESSRREPVVELQGVGKRFSDGTPALDRVDLDLLPGELVSIVGPSGCGKSTLLRIVAGLAGPTSGMVVVRTREISLVFHDPTLPPWSRIGVPLDRPDLLLLDDPFGALDELTRHRRGDELAARYLEQGFAALLVTHSVTEAVFLSSRVVVLSGGPGRVVQAFDVPFGYPRAPRLRGSGAFSRLAGEVAACLRAGAERQAPAGVERPASAGALPSMAGSRPGAARRAGDVAVERR